MADDKTLVPATPSTKINTGNVFTFSNGGVTKATTTGDVTTNTQILISTPPRGPRVDTIDLGDLASAGVAGAEKGTTGKTSTTAGVVGILNDAAAIGQHVLQGNGAEAVTEGMGATGGAGGALTGASSFGAAFGGNPIAIGLGAALGSYLGSKGMKAAGEYLTGGDTPDKLSAPLTLPNNTPLEPTLITPEGSKYALVNAEGKYTWFAMLDNKNLALSNQFVEVVSGSKVAELTNSYLSAPETGFTQQVRELSTKLDIAYQNDAATAQPIDPRAGLRQDEINYQNSLAPNGKAWGTATQTAPNATETFTKGADSGTYIKTIEVKIGDNTTKIVQLIDSATGKPLDEKVFERGLQDAPDGYKLVGSSDYKTGTGWTLNRDTGQMERVSVPKLKITGQPEQNNNDPTNPSSSAAVNGLDKQSDDAAAKREGEEAGKKFGAFGEDLSEGNASPSQSTSGLAGNANNAALQNEEKPLEGESIAGTGISGLPSLTVKVGEGVLVADAGAGLEHLPTGGTTPQAIPTMASQLAGTDLTTAQTTEICKQLTAAGLTAADITVIPLPGGGFLIANSDGDIVGSANPVGTSGVQSYTNASGQTNLLAPSGTRMTATQATIFEATGVDLATPIQYDPKLQGALSGMNAGAALSNAFNNWGHLTDLQRASALVNAYNSASQLVDSRLRGNDDPVPIINEGGTQSPFTPPPSNLASQAGAALNMLMSVQTIGNWDNMGDMQRAQALSSLVSSGNSLTQTFNAGDANFGQNMGQFAAGLSFADALAHGGDRAILTSGLQFANAFNGAADQIISNWVGDAAVGNTVPYVGIAIAVLNFEQNPGAAIGNLIGSYFGGPIGGMIGSAVLGGMFGKSKPPPPEGEIHFEWSAQGGLQIVMDKDVGGAGAFAASFAGSVKNMMEGMVEGANAKTMDSRLRGNDGVSGNDDSGQLPPELLAINPFKLPRMGVNMAGAWIEVMQGDGTVIRENVDNATFGERITAILQDSGALTSQWEVDTIKAHYAQELQTNPAEALAHARAGMGGHAGAGNQAFALQGNAVEAADFKTQSFGALVVHAKMDGVTNTLNQIKTVNVLNNADQDNYIERSEWVSGTDAQGNPQGVLVLDFNGNGQIETRDILNLNGNLGQAGNQTDEARLATSNAGLQRNNANWLDANGDGVLNIWGLSPTAKGAWQKTKNGAKGSDPNWLVRVAPKAVAARPSGYCLARHRALQAAHRLAWRAVA